MRLTLAFVQRAVASFHLWQQNGLTWSKTEVPQVRALTRRSGCPNTVTRHTFCAPCVARSSFRSGCPSFCHVACLLRIACRELRFSVWMLKGAWRCTQGVTEVLDSACVRVRCTAQPYHRKAMPPLFRPLLWMAGGGHWANISFIQAELGEWAGVTTSVPTVVGALPPA